MSNLKASVILDLVDRISRPVRRIEQRFSQLGRSRGLQQLRQAVANVGQQWGNVTGQAGRLTRRLTVLSGAAVGAAWSMRRLVGSFTEPADATIKLSRRLSMTHEQVQLLMGAADRMTTMGSGQLGSSLESFSNRLAQAAAGMGEPAKAMQWAGIALRDSEGNMRGSMDVLMDIADKMASIDSEEMQTRFARAMFGRGGTEMINMLQEGREGLEREMAAFRRTGQLVNEGDAEQAERYNDSLGELDGTLRGLRNTIVVSMLPALNEWLERVNQLIQANSEIVTRRVLEGLSELWAGLQRVGRALAWTADLLGGWGRLAGLAAAIVAGPLILSVLQLALAMFRLAKAIGVIAISAMPAAIAAVRALGTALLTTPVGWILAAIAAIAGAAYLIYRHWEPISGFVARLWATVTGSIGRAVEWISQTLSPTALSAIGRAWIGGLLSAASERLSAFRQRVEQRLQGMAEWIADTLSPTALMGIGRAWIDGLRAGISERLTSLTNWLEHRISGLTSWMPDWAQDRLGLEALGAGPQLGAPMLDEGSGGVPMPGETRVGGELRISIDSEGRPRVESLRRDGPMELDVDLGNWRVWP